MNWFDDFKTVDDGSRPPEGIHTARLEKAIVLPTHTVHKIKHEWRSVEHGFYWEGWAAIEGDNKRFGQELAEALGINIRGLQGESQLENELAAREGQLYLVRVVHKGDWINTYVEERVTTVQETLPSGEAAQTRVEQSDIPIDAELEPAKAGSIFDDDDIPF